jgi:hypothetical protein
MKQLLLAGLMSTAALAVVSATPAGADQISAALATITIDYPTATLPDNWKDPPRQVAPEPSAPRQVAECGDKSVLIALQRSTHAYTIIETNNLRSDDPT